MTPGENRARSSSTSALTITGSGPFRLAFLPDPPPFLRSAPLMASRLKPCACADAPAPAQPTATMPAATTLLHIGCSRSDERFDLRSKGLNLFRVPRPTAESLAQPHIPAALAQIEVEVVLVRWVRAGSEHGREVAARVGADRRQETPLRGFGGERADLKGLSILKIEPHDIDRICERVLAQLLAGLAVLGPALVGGADRHARRVPAEFPVRGRGRGLERPAGQGFRHGAVGDDGRREREAVGESGHAQGPGRAAGAVHDGWQRLVFHAQAPQPLAAGALLPRPRRGGWRGPFGP